MQKKFIFNILFFILFLVLVEIILWAYGKVYFYRHPYAVVTETEWGNRKINSKKSNVILCVGDSYTVGVDGEYENSYPNQLQSIINEKNKKKNYVVINEGVCESNSRQLLRKFPYFLDEHNPNVVLMLIGISNKFNPAGYYNIDEKKFLNRQKENFFSDEKTRIKFWSDLKIYKILRITCVNFKSLLIRNKQKKYYMDKKKLILANVYNGQYKKLKKIKNISDSATSLEKMFFYYNKGDFLEAINIYQNEKSQKDYLFEMLYTACDIFFEQKLFDKVTVELKRMSDYLSPGQLAYLYSSCGSEFMNYRKYGMALNCFLNLMLQDDNFVNFHYLYLTAKIYDLQSEYSSDYVLDVFKSLSIRHPILNNDFDFVNYYKFWHDKETYEKRLFSYLETDLLGIKAICQKRGILLLVQNYPYPYTKMNDFLRFFALKNNLLFIDNSEVFKRQIKDGGLDKYFCRLEHCTRLGHKIQAQNIYNVLSENKLLN